MRHLSKAVVSLMAVVSSAAAAQTPENVLNGRPALRISEGGSATFNAYGCRGSVVRQGGGRTSSLQSSRRRALLRAVRCLLSAAGLLRPASFAAAQAAIPVSDEEAAEGKSELADLKREKRGRAAERLHQDLPRAA